MTNIDPGQAATTLHSILLALGNTPNPTGQIDTVSKATPTPASSTPTRIGSYSAVGNTDPNAVDAFLAATRQHESGNNYTIYNQSGLSNASGAYQFLGSTWQGLGGSTANAAEASPEEQDRIAKSYAQSLFDQFHDWRLVAIAWYGGPGVAQQVANGQDPGAPDQQGGYLAYGDTIIQMMQALQAND
jgi:hypothetical protein